MTLTISKCKLSKQQHTITLDYTLGENEKNSLIFTLMICRNFLAHRNAVCKTRDGMAHLKNRKIDLRKRKSWIYLLNRVCQIFDTYLGFCTIDCLLWPFPSFFFLTHFLTHSLCRSCSGCRDVEDSFCPFLPKRSRVCVTLVYESVWLISVSQVCVTLVYESVWHISVPRVYVTLVYESVWRISVPRVCVTHFSSSGLCDSSLRVCVTHFSSSGLGDLSLRVCVTHFQFLGSGWP